MKCLIMFAVLVLGFATSGAAQQKTMTQAQVLEMAKAIATAQGIKVIDDSAPQQPALAKPSVPSAANSYEQYIARELAQQKVAIDAFMAQNTGGPMNYQQYQPVHSFQDNGMFWGDNYLQRAIDRDKWGALKFKKGDELVMENIEVYGCGKRIIQADEANNIWDHVALVPVGCSPLTFRYTDGLGKDWEVEIDEMIVPLRLQRSKNITLDENFFAKARERTMRISYDFVEQPDGSFKKVPRNP